MLLKHCLVALRGTRHAFSLQTAINLPASSSLVATQRFYSSVPAIGIVDYDVVKMLAREPQKLLIDVREPDELTKTGQIPSSINIPLGIVSQELSASPELFKSKYGREKPQATTEIIFHCMIGKRSLKAAETAAALGFKNLKNYEGSWTDWAKREGLAK
ncbi:rhodanese domain-containing protein CG4456 [Drosophila guanche]|uniref:Blast:Heat shock protein 67B2 n=1 Tax=Drosophila guanche TaxID=7266 RepID=A0A3B0K9I3_DROGU|nr:rhodanese domain-containing protein CG4456 [Drosophila guanche]SPP82729.1 blast:Heat shock protein 67B2 [Drosophila guanche]